MNRRSLLRLIGLAPVAAAKAAPQEFGSRFMVLDPWTTTVGSTLERHAAGLGLDQAEAVQQRLVEDEIVRAFRLTETTCGPDICPPGSDDHHPDGAWAPNAPGFGEGDDGRAVAQGYSAAAEAHPDSGSRTGRRNEEVGRDGAGASAEPGRTLGHMNSPDGASDVLGGFPVAAAGREMRRNRRTAAYARMGRRGTPLGSGATAGETAPGAGATAGRVAGIAPAPGLIVHPSYLDLYPDELQPGGAA